MAVLAVLGVIVWIGGCVPSMKYLLYDNDKEPMAPILYVVAVVFGPVCVGLALAKLSIRAFQWMFKARV